MNARKCYQAFFYLLLVLAAITVVWQFWMLGKEQKKEEQIWKICAQSLDGEIPEEMLLTMQEFPGLEKIQTVLEAEVTVSVDGYTMQAVIQGVDFTTFPLNAVKSAGKKQMGLSPLLAVGEDVFSQLQDLDGRGITVRQKDLLLEHITDLKAKIKLNGEERRGDEGEFLAVVKESGIFMEKVQMQQWLSSKEMETKTGKVYLEIKGEQEAVQAESSLQKAGLEVRREK